MSLMRRANIVSNSGLTIQSAPFYNFGAGDFTITAMIESTQGGVLVARMATGTSGFALSVNSAGAILLSFSDGANSYEAQTPATSILSGSCHSIIAVRASGVISVYLDGQALPVTGSGSGSAQLNVDSAQPVTIGCLAGAKGGALQYVGAIMNVGLWSIALTGDALVAAAFARVSSSDPGLQGYWMLDASSDDMSVNDNPAQIMGPLTWSACLNCTWTQGANDFSFFRVINLVSALEAESKAVQATTIAVTRPLVVPAGAPVLCASALADSDSPHYPAGVQISIIDPTGKQWDQAQNDSAAFVTTVNGQPSALMIPNPVAGAWTITVTAPASVGFSFQAQTVPSADVATTTANALQPLYGQAQNAKFKYAEVSLGSVWSTLATIAVAAVVGVVVGAVAIASGGTAVPAVLAGLVAFSAIGLPVLQDALSNSLSSSSVNTSTGQVGGAAGFIVSVDTLQLIDANANADPATQLIYKRRSKKLYPYVAVSPFNTKQKQLIQNQDKRINVATALLAFSSGYVTASGHGRPGYLTGWYVSGNTGPLEEVLTVGKYNVNEVKGRIFHFFACYCGYKGAIGIGRDMVKNGAVAFFGYAQPFAMPTTEYPTFCDCDIVIDTSLIDGKTCDQAYQASYAAYTKAINTYKANGDMQSAALLEGNRDNLVAPSTDPAYGDMTAKLL